MKNIETFYKAIKSILQLKNKFQNLSEILNKIIIALLCILLVSLPIASISSIRDICLMTALALWVTQMAIERRILIQRTPIDIPLFIYGAIALISIFYAVDWRYSLREFRGEYLKGALLFYLTVSNIKTESDLKILLSTLIAGNVLMVSYGIYDFFATGGNFSWRGTGANASGWHSLHSGGGTYSTYLIIMFPFLFWGLAVEAAKRYRLLSIFLILANIFSLYVSYQRGAWIAFFVSIPIFPFFIARGYMSRFQAVIVAWMLCITLWMLCITSISIAPDIIFQGKTPSNFLKDKTTSPGWRIDRWHHSLKAIIKKPIIGTGFGQYSPSKQNGYLILDDNNPNSRTHAHNTLLNIGLQLGIPGVLAFLSIIWILCASALKKYSNTTPCSLPKFLAGSLFMMIVGCMTRNMFDNFLIDDTALLFWFIAGMCSYNGPQKPDRGIRW